MNQEESNEKFRNSSFLPLHSGGISWPLTQESFIPCYQLVLSLIPPMADNTRSHTISRLEEAVTHFTQNQNTLTTTQNSLHSRLDEVISCLQALETSSPTLMVILPLGS